MNEYIKLTLSYITGEFTSTAPLTRGNVLSILKSKHILVDEHDEYFSSPNLVVTYQDLNTVLSWFGKNFCEENEDKKLTYQDLLDILQKLGLENDKDFFIPHYAVYSILYNCSVLVPKPVKFLRNNKPIKCVNVMGIVEYSKIFLGIPPCQRSYYSQSYVTYEFLKKELKQSFSFDLKREDVFRAI